MRPDEDDCECEAQVVERPTMEVISEGQKGPLGFDLRPRKIRLREARMKLKKKKRRKRN